mgnify:CR=1 FL=1
MTEAEASGAMERVVPIYPEVPGVAGRIVEKAVRAAALAEWDHQPLLILQLTPLFAGGAADQLDDPVARPREDQHRVVHLGQFHVDQARAAHTADFFRALEALQGETDAVFCVGVASRCLADGSIPHEAWVREAGYTLSPNGKTNLGLGRPLYEGS